MTRPADVTQLDGERLAVLRPLLGDARLLALVTELATGLRALPGVAGTDRDKLLHRLRGGAASLGFAVLAAQLAEAETRRAPIPALAAEPERLVAVFTAWLHGRSAQR